MNQSLAAIAVASLFSAAALAGAPAPKVKAPKATPELLAKGKTVFNTNCAPCHGESGDGNGPAAAALNPKPRNIKTEAFKQGDKPEQVFETVTKGIPGTTMVTWAQLSEDDRWAAVHHVLALHKGAPKSKPAPAKKK